MGDVMDIHSHICGSAPKWNLFFVLPNLTLLTLGAKIDAYENHMRQTHMVHTCADRGTKVSITFVAPLFSPLCHPRKQRCNKGDSFTSHII
jgi:hypothetical protein